MLAGFDESPLMDLFSESFLANKKAPNMGLFQ